MHSYYSVVSEYRGNSLDESVKDITARKQSKELYEDSLAFKKFFYFLSAPVLVFRTEYPRNKEFRLSYFIKKGLQTLFHLVILYSTIALDCCI